MSGLCWQTYKKRMKMPKQNGFLLYVLTRTLLVPAVTALVRNNLPRRAVFVTE